MAIDKKLIFWKKQSTFNAPSSTTDTTGSVMWYSIVFFKDTGQIWTNGTYYNCGIWGTPQTNYVPLTIGGTLYNLSRDGHTHSSFLDLELKNILGGDINHRLELGFSARNYVNWYEYGGLWKFILRQDGVDTELFKITPSNIFYKDNTVWHEGNFNPSNYLSSFGGTLSGVLYTDSQILFNNNTLDLSWGGYINGKATINGNGGLNIYPLGNLFSGDVTINGSKVWHAGNFNPANYLPLSGGTLTNSAYGGQLVIDRTATGGGAVILYKNSVDGWIKAMGVNGMGRPDFDGYVMWHAGNDGAGSGLDADLLDGVHNGDVTARYFKRQTTSLDANNPSSPYMWFYGQPNSGIVNWASTDFGAIFTTLNEAHDLNAQFNWFINHNSETPTRSLFFRASNNLGFKNDWKQIAFTTDNVASATKLANTKYIWGQPFNGEGDVDGLLYINNNTSDGGITIKNTSDTYSRIRFFDSTENFATIHAFSGYPFLYNNQKCLNLDVISSGAISFGDWNNPIMYINKSNGNVGIGTAANAGYKLDVNGTGRFNGNVVVDSSIYSGFHIESPDGGLGMNRRADNALGFYAGNNLYASLKKNGNFIIGTNETDAGYKLDVNGTFRANEAYLTSITTYASDGMYIDQYGNFYSKKGTSTPTNNSWSINSSTTGNSGVFYYWASGNLIVGSSVNAGYKLDVNGTFRTTGAAYLNSTLSVTGTSTLTGLLTANGGISSTTGTFSDKIISGTGRGFRNSGFQTGFNPIWSFNNAETFGIGYYQGAHGLPGVSSDAIGFHFGNISEPSLTIDAWGGVISDSYITASRFYTGYDAGVANSFCCSNWFRSNGATGWYNHTYGAGILSDTSNIVRTYGTNKFKVFNTESDSISTNGGIAAQSVGNDYNGAAFQAFGNGAANTVFPTIGFHQPGMYASSIQLRSAGNFYFYQQGASGLANINAQVGTFNGYAQAASFKGEDGTTMTMSSTSMIYNGYTVWNTGNFDSKYTKDTGWLALSVGSSFTGSSLYVRQVGRLVMVQGYLTSTLDVQTADLLLTTLPTAVGTPYATVGGVSFIGPNKNEYKQSAMWKITTNRSVYVYNVKSMTAHYINYSYYTSD